MIRATITDTAAIEQLKLADVIAYLDRAGWTVQDRATPGVCGWAAPRPFIMNGMQRSWLVLPAADADGRFADQTARVGEAVAMLAASQDRSQLDVFVELGGDLGA